jgi:O-antigen/teichoic acid export membrane protein
MFVKLKRLSLQSAVYTAGDLLNRAFGLLLIPVYTAYLTPEDYGILAITSTIASMLAILSMQSLESALTRFHYDYHDETNRRNYHGTIWILMLFSALVVAVIAGTVARPIFAWLFPDVPYQPYIQLVVWTTFVTNVSYVLLKSLLRVRERPTTFSTLNIVVFLVNTVFVIYFVVGRDQGAQGNLVGRLLAAVLLAAPFIVLYFRDARLHWSTKEAKTSLLFALPLVPHLLSLWVLNVSDRIILQRFVPLSEVGIYSLGYQIASILQLLAFSVTNAWSPFFYKTAGEPDAPRMLSRFSTYYILLVVFLGAGISALAEDMLLIVASNPAYFTAYRVVPWVVMGFVMRGFYFLFVTALYYKKQVRALPFVTIGAGLLNIGLNLLTVPIYGYMAAAVNTFVAYAAQAFVMYFLAQRAFRLPYETARFGKMIGVGITLYLVASTLPSFNPWAALFAKAAIVMTFPIWLTLLAFWTPDEKAVFRQSAHRMVGKFLTR